MSDVILRYATRKTSATEQQLLSEAWIIDTWGLAHFPDLFPVALRLAGSTCKFSAQQ